MRPNTEGPSKMPPMISPITRACPSRSASQPQPSVASMMTAIWSRSRVMGHQDRFWLDADRGPLNDLYQGIEKLCCGIRGRNGWITRSPPWGGGDAVIPELLRVFSRDWRVRFVASDPVGPGRAFLFSGKTSKTFLRVEKPYARILACLTGS